MVLILPILSLPILVGLAFEGYWYVSLGIAAVFAGGLYLSYRAEQERQHDLRLSER